MLRLYPNSQFDLAVTSARHHHSKEWSMVNGQWSMVNGQWSGQFQNSEVILKCIAGDLTRGAADAAEGSTIGECCWQAGCIYS